MNTKGPRPAVAVTVVNLDSGDTRSFPSITKAAAWMCVEKTKAIDMVNHGRQYLNWYCYPTGEDRTELIEALKSRYKHYQRPVAKRKKAKAELVSLRIDAKTVIMVTPDKSTPEYAEHWRSRLKNQVDKPVCKNKVPQDRVTKLSQFINNMPFGLYDEFRAKVEDEMNVTGTTFLNWQKGVFEPSDDKKEALDSIALEITGETIFYPKKKK